ncbi:hypothetical protein H6F89_00830 [Cyanobacteria bacterium FACHB-63]|nr:hypothetical protein [Cyanobacteria bacterium FACHB-63]
MRYWKNSDTGIPPEYFCVDRNTLDYTEISDFQSLAASNEKQRLSIEESTLCVTVDPQPP